MIVAKIKIPIYSNSLTVLVYEKCDELDEFLKKKHPDHELDVAIEYFDAGVFTMDNVNYVAFHKRIQGKKKYPTPGIIAHEAKHAVNQIFQEQRIYLDLENDEPEAYLLGFIVDRLHEKIYPNG